MNVTFETHLKLFFPAPDNDKYASIMFDILYN